MGILAKQNGDVCVYLKTVRIPPGQSNIEMENPGFCPEASIYRHLITGGYPTK